MSVRVRLRGAVYFSHSGVSVGHFLPRFIFILANIISAFLLSQQVLFDV